MQREGKPKKLWMLGAGAIALVVIVLILILAWPRQEAVQTVGSAGDIAMISAKYKETLVLKKDGTLFIWGSNNYGQAGDGTATTRKMPGPVTVIEKVALAATGYHTAVIDKSRAVFIWGSNIYGQLGNGGSDDSLHPVQLPDVKDIKAFGIGKSFTMALKKDGSLISWGLNQYGQLGNGTTTRQSMPVKVKDLDGVVDLDSSMDHTVALKKDGTVWVWGDNRYGQMGDGTTINKLAPFKVKDMTDMIDVAAGYYHYVFLKKDGTVWCLGFNWYGQAAGTQLKSVVNSPASVPELTGVKAVAAGNNHSIALKEDGTVWVWGDNSMGQLGNRTVKNCSATPVQVTGLTGVVAVAAGCDHNVALKEDGSVWVWGSNGSGELGLGEDVLMEVEPIQVKL